MRLIDFPHYCGGKLLFGLWSEKEIASSSRKSDNDIEQALYKVIVGKDTYHYSNSKYPDGRSPESWQEDKLCRVPIELESFQACLKLLLTYTREYSVNDLDSIYGVIIAVTSPTQKVAMKHLEQTGFVNSGKYWKTGENNCTVWHGENNIVNPIIVKARKITDGSSIKGKFK